MAQVSTAVDLTSTEYSSADFESENAAYDDEASIEADTDDRRVWQRFLLEDPAHITLTVEGRDAYDKVALVDVSLGGFRLQFNGDLPRDSDVAICHPTAGTMRGRLAWQRGGDIGIRMLDDDDRRTYLLRLISLILHSEVQVEAV